MAKFIKMICMTGLGMMLLCLCACEQQEPEKKQPQVTVVSKSIDRSKRPDQSKKADRAEKTDQPEKTDSVKKVNLSEKATGPKETALSKRVDKTGQPASVTASAEHEKAAEPVKEKAVEQTADDGGSDDAPMVVKKYDTKGRVDPFIPLLRERSDEAQPEKAEEEKPRRILTPLEKIDLSQLKLVAVVEMDGRYMAMVEEASGKGYEIRVGAYIGRKGGRVSAIDNNGIMVKEYVRDFKGNRKERIQEIKFNNSQGGE